MNGYQLTNFCEVDKFAAKSYCAIHDVPESLNLGDITMVDETALKPFTMTCAGSPCFPAGTLVNTDGGYKRIEDIRVTDKVLTHNGQYCQVLDTHYTGRKQLMRLRAMGINYIDATPNHMFLILKSRSAGIMEWKRLDEIQKGYYLAIPIIQTEENPMALSKEECWLIGRYIADGYVRTQQRMDRPEGSKYANVVYCIGNGKEEEFESHLDHYKACKSANTGNVFKYTIQSHRLVQLCESCGMHAINKHFPQFILNLPIDLLCEAINGYMSGDGCFVDGLYKATSISQTLAYSLGHAVLKAFHVPYRLYEIKAPATTMIEGRIVNQHTQWQIVFKKNPCDKDRAFCAGKWAWVPVRGVDCLNNPSAVYDITVDRDHSFCVKNIAVHNCQDFSISGKQVGVINKLISVYGYTMKALMRYIDDLATYEALTEMHHLVNELSDYCRMMQAISPRFDRYPRHFLTTHQIAVRNYNRMKQDFDEAVFKCRRNPDMECVVGNYVFIYPASTQAIKDEAAQQHNCVASYISKVIDGECDILFMRDRESPDQSLVTIEVRNGRIVQARRKYNDKVVKSESDAIGQWNQRYQRLLKKKSLEEKHHAA